MSDDKKNNIPKTKQFSDNKVFVMTRPAEGEDHLSIATEEFNKLEGDLAELYHAVYFDYLLNLGGELTIKQHKLLLAQMTAPLAYQFFLTNSEKAHGIVQSSLAQLKAQKVDTDFITKMPDEVSILDYILKHNLYNFLSDLEDDPDTALAEHEEFLDDLEHLFFTLPAAFCFGMVEAVSLITKSKAKKTKPKPKK
jgi:hypothetical protein